MGHFLEQTLVEYLPTYPLGAGLGRWGMMNYYFSENSTAQPLYAEIQLTGWVFDGGLPLTLCYIALLIAAGRSVYVMSRRAEADSFSLLATFVLAFDVGIGALVFSYPIFCSQLGLDFWIVNSTLLAAGRAKF